MSKSLPLVATLLLALPLPIAADTLSDQLKAALEANPDFRALTPPGYRLKRVQMESNISPGQLVWGPSPDPIGLVPVSVGSPTPFVNCAYEGARIGSQTLNVVHTDTYSFTVTEGASLTSEISVSGGWPLVDVTATVSGTLSRDVSRQTIETRTLEEGVKIEGPIPPRHYFEVQVQAFERPIANQPFHVDVEVVGNARAFYETETRFLPRAQVPRDARVKAGDEPTGRGNNRRDLNVCRVGINPGKVVGNTCNWTFAGDERLSRSYELLSMAAGTYKWMDRDDFEAAHDDDSVKNDESPAIVAGIEDRDDRYNGRLLVCRAEHRGGVHPGKVVINHCMIGFGGRELEKRDYDVLVSTEPREEQRQIALRDYLSDGLRTFRVNGVFDGARAMSYTVVAGPNLPVDGRFCAQAPSEAALPRTAEGPPPPAQTPVTRAMASDTQVGALALQADSTQKDVPPVEAVQVANLLDGRAAAQVDLTQDSALVPVEVVYRTLSLQEPKMFGIDVLALQRRLDAAGWPVRLDGFFGVNTARAVSAFQAAHGLEADGVFGPATNARLARIE